MPVRSTGGNSLEGRQQSQRPQRGQVENQRVNTRQPEPQNDEGGDDVWDEVMNMKGKGEDGGFNKMNTNFYLSNGEECEVQLVDENPTIFWGHAIKCTSKNGKTFYRMEQCQKSQQDHCVLCESNNGAVGKARKVIAFRIIDGRGTWKKEQNGGGGFDGVPVPKIFQVPLYLAKAIKNLKDEAGGEITDKILKLSKNENYMINFKFNKNGKQLEYAEMEPWDEDQDGELPDILEVFKPMEDRELMDFVQQFADNSGGGNNNRGGGNNGGNNGGGGFGQTGRRRGFGN